MNLKVFKNLATASLLIFILTYEINCGSSSESGSGSSTSTSFTQIGPQGGFIPAVAFNPSQSGVAWASGDDGGGLYKSTDGGASWTLIQTGAVNQSTYSLRFDPTNSNTIYAPNHFGRGMLKSTNGGTSWSATQSGLPVSGSSSQTLSDIAINPTNSSDVFVGTDNGLYRSTDSGANFTINSTTLAGTAAVRSVAYRQDGILFIGKSDGALGYSGDNGGTWTQLLAPSGVSISQLSFSSSSLYVVYATADIYRLDKSTFAGGLINDHTQSGSIQNGNRIVLAVKSGASAASDLVYVGSMGSSSISSTQWGLFKSTNGGTSWTQTMSGMAGNYIMSVAIDPNNSNNVVVGSGLGRGICHSTDGGSNWSCVTQGLYATASLALAQDSANANHLLASNTACGGFSSNYETTDGGSSWTRFSDPITSDGIFAFDINPSSSSTIIAGTCTQGILRTTGGVSGSWSTVTATAGQRVDRFVRDRSNTSIIYAVVPAGDANHSLYLSTNSGAAFSPRSSTTAWNIAVHPTNLSEAVVVNGTDAYVSTDSFATSHSLSLSTQASSEGGLVAVAYNPGTPTEVLVGGGSGGIYKTTNYNSAGTSVTWTQLSSPVTSATIRDIVIVNRNSRSVYYVAAMKGDINVTSSSTSGVFESLDGGQTWTALTSGLFPSTLVWRLLPDVASPTTSLLGGMWAGGLFKLSDNQ